MDATLIGHAARSNWKLPVARIFKSLYGLPRAGEDWARVAREFLESMGFERILDTLEESAFLRRFANSEAVVLVLVYVDDMLIAGPREHAIAPQDCGEIRRRTSAEFSSEFIHRGSAN